MAGFLARAFKPFIGLGRAIVSFGLGGSGSGGGPAPQLPSGDVLLRVCDGHIVELRVCEPEIARIVIEDTG